MFGVLALALYLAAAIGLSALAGYDPVRHRLAEIEPGWIVAGLGGVVTALVGYVLSWRGIAEHPGGPQISARERNAIVVAGFGGFIAKGGSALDKEAMLAGGVEEHAAEVRVAGIDSLEHLPLALGCCAAAIFLLAAGRTDPPPLDFIWPWAVAPPVGAVVAIVATRRRPPSWREASGFRRFAAIALDGIAFLGELLARPAGRVAATGMATSFAGQIFALWASIRAFGYGVSIPTVILCDAIGYVLTRRSAPLGGAGFIDCFIVLCLWDCNVPLAAAVAGVFTYRFLSLFVMMPFSWRALPIVSAIGSSGEHPGRARQSVTTTGSAVNTSWSADA
jgi:uncharacterized membrane protein YbhN (UPF0104 family)